MNKSIRNIVGGLVFTLSLGLCGVAGAYGVYGGGYHGAGYHGGYYHGGYGGFGYRGIGFGYPGIGIGVGYPGYGYGHRIYNPGYGYGHRFYIGAPYGRYNYGPACHTARVCNYNRCWLRRNCM